MNPLVRSRALPRPRGLAPPASCASSDHFHLCPNPLLQTLSGTALTAASVTTGAQVGLWQVAAPNAFGVMLAIYSTWWISGAHLNPAVTLAIAVNRRAEFPARWILPFWGAQLLGAVVGGAITLAVFAPFLDHYEALHNIVRGSPESVVTAMSFGLYAPNPGLFPPGMGPNGSPSGLVSTASAFFTEMWATALLISVIFAVSDSRNTAFGPARSSRRDNSKMPLLVGFCVAFLNSMFAPITMCGMNPARDFGPRLVAAMAGWGRIAIPGPDNDFWVYILGPLVGAVPALYLYDLAMRFGWEEVDTTADADRSSATTTADGILASINADAMAATKGAEDRGAAASPGGASLYSPLLLADGDRAGGGDGRASYGAVGTRAAPWSATSATTAGAASGAVLAGDGRETDAGSHGEGDGGDGEEAGTDDDDSDADSRGKGGGRGGLKRRLLAARDRFFPSAAGGSGTQSQQQQQQHHLRRVTDYASARLAGADETNSEDTFLRLEEEILRRLVLLEAAQRAQLASSGAATPGHFNPTPNPGRTGPAHAATTPATATAPTTSPSSRATTTELTAMTGMTGTTTATTATTVGGVATAAPRQDRLNTLVRLVSEVSSSRRQLLGTEPRADRDARTAPPRSEEARGDDGK